MFGQSNTPFGSSGGGFGQQANTSPFGAAPSSGGLFGSPAPAPFGAPAPSGFGGSTFGAPAPQGGLFGSSAPTSFGAPPPSSGFGSTFGAPSPAPGLFGSPPATAPSFGAPAPAGGGLFGSTSAAPFGSTGTSTFGGGSSTFGSTFGAPAPTTGLFGQPAPAPSTFGQSTFGQPASSTGGFGQSTFGQPAPAPLFGQPAPAPSFGMAAPSSTFGASTSTFGSGTSTFGAPAPSGGLFGAPAPTSAGLFGAPGASASGTRAVPYQPTNKQDNNNTISLQAISGMPQYQDKSFEELRFEDYSQGNRGSSTTPTAAGSSSFGFGGTAPAPAFGAPAPSTFGAAPTGSIFGSTPAPSPFGAPAPSTFGAPAPSTSLFGAPAPSSGFGSTFGSPAPAPSGGLFSSAPAPFGAPAPSAFGAPAPSSGLFGSPAPAPAFGSTFGSPAPAPSGGLFGSSPAPYSFGSSAPAPSGSIFGGSPAPAPFGATSAFGSPAPAAGGFLGAPAPASSGFGAFGAAKPPGTSLFGAPAPAPFGGFGSPAPAPFGAPAPSLFGAPAPAAFGAPAQAPFVAAQQAPGLVLPPNAVIIPQAANDILEQQLRAIESKRKDIEKLAAWGGDRSTTPSTTPLSQPDPYAISKRQATMPFPTSSPRSAARIRPRGFPKSLSETKSTSASAGFISRDDSGLMSPEAHIRTSRMQLIIKPDALGKSYRRQKAELALTAAFPSVTSPKESTDSVAETSTTPAPLETPPIDEARDLTSEAESPGFDYYQKVIASEVNGGNEPVTPTFQSTASRMTSQVPKLTKKGYEIFPSLEELSKMSDADLATVRNFTVSRPGFGMVEWEGCVDVRGADLDRIVVIERQDVSVYTLEEDEGTKPEVGVKLNRPAVITFYGVFSRNGGAGASDEEKLKFSKKVEKITNKIGAEFMSYDPETGVWKIRVLHFSRYGLFDDNSDDEEYVLQETTNSAEQLAMKGTDKVYSSHVGVQDTEMSSEMEQEDDYSEKFVEMADDTEEVRIEAARAAAALTAFVGPLGRNKVNTLYPSMSQTIDFADDADLVEYTLPQRYKIPPDQILLDEAMRGTSLCAKLALKSEVNDSAVDYGLRMGRSFRVGWLPDGSFFNPRPKNIRGPSLPVRYRPVLAGKLALSSTSQLNEVALAYAERKPAKDNCRSESLIFTVPTIQGQAPEKLIEYVRRCKESHFEGKESRAAFGLLLSLIPIDTETDKRIESSHMIHVKCRRFAAIFKWVVELCSSEIDAEIRKALESNDVPAALFSALSGGDVAKACGIAAKAGFTSLAAVLSLGHQGRKDILDQLDQLANSRTYPRRMRQVFEIVSGKRMATEEFRALSWKRRLALSMFQTNDYDLEKILHSFQQDVDSGAIAAPLPAYYKPSMIASVQSTLYRLLLYTCGEGKRESVVDVIDPRGLTPFCHDFSVPYYLLSVLSASNVVVEELDFFEIERIIDGFASQLVSSGDWAWAVIISLNSMCKLPIQVEAFKVMRAKNIILQHFVSSDSRACRCRTFLESNAGIPKEWFEEALAYRAITNFDEPSFIKHSICFAPLKTIYDLETKFTPSVFFSSKAQLPERMDTLRDIASVFPESLCASMYKLIVLESKVQSLRNMTDQQRKVLLPEIEDSYSSIQSSLQVFTLRKYDENLALIEPSHSAPVHSMVSHALDVLRRLEVKIQGAWAAISV